MKNPEITTDLLSTESRKSVLAIAKDCVLHDRNATHGNPEDNFKFIANYLNNFAASRGWQTNFNATDVAAIMILMKVSRIATSPDKLDHWVDIAGYSACGAGCESVSKGELLK